VLFESPDGAFGGVALVTVGWNQLISDIIDGEEILQSGQCFVVESLELWFETFDGELLMDAVICFDPLRGGPGLHWNDNITLHKSFLCCIGPGNFLSGRCRVDPD
jgi:hypothetical protein